MPVVADRGLRRGVMYAYCFFRLPLSPIDFTLRLSARTSVWQDTLKMTASMQAMLVAGAKSLDFLLGFLVGKASDNTRTRFGRRLPYIAICFPVGLVAFLLFSNAGYLFTRRRTAELPCADLVSAHAPNATSCPDLKQCLDEAIAAGTLWHPSDASAGGAATGVSTSLPASQALFFAASYFCFQFFTWTCTQIPYDALGMELTDDYHERTRLFGTKATYQFLGYLCHPLAGMFLSTMFTDLLIINAARSFLFAAFGLVALARLLSSVRERPAPSSFAADATDAGAAGAVEGSSDARWHVQQNARQNGRPARRPVPPIPSARRALNSRPYRRYLAMKVPLSLFSLLPSNMLSFYIKYTLALENFTFFESYTMVGAWHPLARSCGMPNHSTPCVCCRPAQLLFLLYPSP